MAPDPSRLREALGLAAPLIGYYDTDDPEAFRPRAASHRCFFAAYREWRDGKSTRLSAGDFGCPPQSTSFRPALIARAIFSAVMGTDLIRIPSASSTALARAGITGIMVCSPTPRAP